MYKGLIRRCKIMILVSCIFIVLVGVSIMFYPGGSLSDRTSVHFDFIQNYFSDLGSTYTVTGKLNSASQAFFTIAMGMFGLVLIYFSGIWRAAGVDAHDRKFIGILSNFFLVVCGAGLIGMAFLPWNLNFEDHVTVYKASIVSLLIWYLFILILQAGNEKLKNVFTLNLILFLILCAYCYYLIFVSEFGSTGAAGLQALLQSVIMIIIPVNLIFQSIGLLHFLRISDFRRSGMKNFYI